MAIALNTARESGAKIPRKLGASMTPKGKALREKYRRGKRK